MTTLEILKSAKRAVPGLARADSDTKNRALLAMADALTAHQDSILAANGEDLEAAKAKIWELVGTVNSYFDGTAEPRPDEPQAGGFTTVDEEYFSDALFIGDSLTDGLRLYHPIGDAKYFCGTSMTTYKILESTQEAYGYTGLRALLQGERFGKVYVMLSINEAANNNEAYVSGYQKILDLIRETQPDALIYIQSILYVTQEHAIQDPNLKTENIQEKNGLLKGLTNGEDILYLEVNDAINDGTDHMVAEYTGDGVHFKAKYYSIWADYLMEHAWVDADHPAEP
jgi:lysophospholipase L1-like esterase